MFIFSSLALRRNSMTLQTSFTPFRIFQCAWVHWIANDCSSSESRLDLDKSIMLTNVITVSPCLLWLMHTTASYMWKWVPGDDLLMLEIGTGAACVMVLKHTLNVPLAATLPFINPKSQNMMFGDDAFPLKRHLMKPYPARNITEEQRIFNYWLPRARRVSKNAFGILTSKVRVWEANSCKSRSRKECAL